MRPFSIAKQTGSGEMVQCLRALVKSEPEFHFSERTPAGLCSNSTCMMWYLCAPPTHTQNEKERETDGQTDRQRQRDPLLALFMVSG